MAAASFVFVDQAIPVADQGLLLIGWFNAEPEASVRVVCHCGSSSFVVSDNWIRIVRRDVTAHLAQAGIQLVSRARKAGLAISPRAVFQHQTVASLAAVAVATQATASELRDVASGALPLTPIMHWLVERGGPLERFHQAMLLQVPAGLRGEDLSAALQGVIDHHDALRLRLIWRAPDESDVVTLQIAPAGAGDAAPSKYRLR